MISLTFAHHDNAEIQFRVALMSSILLLLVTLGLVNRSFFVLLLDLRLVFFRVCLLLSMRTPKDKDPPGVDSTRPPNPTS